MIRPTRLSEDALAVLRAFVATRRKAAGSRLSMDELEESWRREASGIAAGLSELEAAELVVCDGSHAVVTDLGGRFFKRYHHSCH